MLFKKEDFTCSQCSEDSDTPPTIVADGKCFGPTSRKIRHLEELGPHPDDKAKLGQSTTFKQRTFLSKMRERKLLRYLNLFFICQKYFPSDLTKIFSVGQKYFPSLKNISRPSKIFSVSQNISRLSKIFPVSQKYFPSGQKYFPSLKNNTHLTCLPHWSQVKYFLSLKNISRL